MLYDVLLLEDAATDVELIRRSLRECARVTATAERNDFLNLLRNIRFDVIIADWIVPGFADGEALNLVQEIRPELPVIILSGVMTEHSASKACRHGAADFLMKDRLEWLPQAIDQAIEKGNLKLQLSRAQRMDSAGAMASGIMHDLRNLMTVPILTVDFLRDQIDPKFKPMLGVAKEYLDESIQLTNQLLAFVKGPNGSDRSVLNIRGALEQIISLISHSLPVNIVLDLRCPEHLAIRAIKTQFEQVITNLCLNARDAIGANSAGRIEVIVDELTTTGGIFVRISLTDNGCGMSKETAARIFDPFYTTKNTGNGLGLTTALRIIHEHHGIMQVSSELDRGTTFTIMLPSANKMTLEEAPATGISKGSGESILHVDDEEGLRVITKLALEANGYECIPAENGAAAMEHAKSVQVALVDLKMPGIAGEDLMKRLRDLNPKLRIVCVSGALTETETWPEADAHLRKPYTTAQLLETLRNVLQSSVS